MNVPKLLENGPLTVTRNPTTFLKPAHTHSFPQLAYIKFSQLSSHLYLSFLLSHRQRYCLLLYRKIEFLGGELPQPLHTKHANMDISANLFLSIPHLMSQHYS